MSSTTAELLSNPAQLKSSLEAHNASFDQLLRYIPAKYYIRPESDDEDDKPANQEQKLTKAQRKALAKAKKDEAVRVAKNEAKREARLAAYDPDAPKTIAEIQAAKLSAAAKGKKRAAASDDGSEGAWQDEEEDSPNESDFADSDDEDIAEGDFLELDEAGVLLKKKKEQQKEEGPAPTITELREKLQKRIADIQAAKAGKAGGKAGAKKTAAKEKEGGEDEEDDESEPEIKSKDDLLEERRRRAALRDNRRKKVKEQKRLEKSEGAKRRATEPSNGRAGGGKVNVRQAEEERPRKKAKADSPFGDDSAALVPYDASASSSTALSASKSDPSSIAFSNLDFTSSSQHASEAGMTPAALKKMQKASGTLIKNRHALPKDANQALEILAKRKARMDELDPEKREKAEEKERWEKVNLKAEGEKVRDDEKRLKKMAKRQEREKKKSAKAWSDRKATVEKTVSDRIAKRNTNLAARSQAKKDKKAGIKKKSGGAGGAAGKKTSSTSSGKTRAKGRPGFEGGGRKKK
ncbi:hypothetical protein JCM8547_001799 [Rhodosporidiobolus lusitaniae]